MFCSNSKITFFLIQGCFNYIIQIVYRPYLDYGDIIYEQAFNSSFYEKHESNQYNISLACSLGIIF